MTATIKKSGQWSAATIAAIKNVLGFDAKLTVLKLTDGADCTNVIQSALNNKGHIKIVTAGTFLVNRLVIDDNTIFELCEGVILKKKDGTNTNILTNKGYLNSYRNRNIQIKGGEWNLNSTGNPTPINGLGMIGILLKGIDNLKITDVKSIGGELKYCYLIADCINVYCGNINFANESDGLHFQPPLKNVLIENITGWTHDDMISFTMGDYPNYILGDTGDIENVLVRNVYASDGTDEHIKLVGDGINGNSVFRNMRFENIRGEATVASVAIFARDQAAPNAYLNHTYLENIVFSGINPKCSGNIPVFLLTCTKGDVTIENCTYNQDSSRFIHCAVIGNGGVLNKLTLRNIKSLAPQAKILNSLVRCDASMSINVLNIEDCQLDMSLSTAEYYAIYSTNNSIKKINVTNSWFKFASNSFIFYCDGSSANDMIIHINNSYIELCKLILTSTPVDISVSNSEYILQANANLAFIIDNGHVKYKTSNNQYNNAILTNITTALRKLSLRGFDAGYAGLLSTLTPSEGDMVRSANASEPTGKGVYYYNGSAWVKMTT